MRNYRLSLILFFTAAVAFAQSDASSELFKTLKTNDSLLFNAGFNMCDIQQFENLVSDNFEFYHDKSGVTDSKAAFISGIKDGLCKLPYKPRRKLEDESVEVYPLKKNGVLYGAIQMGRHRFYALEKDKPEYLTSVARFTHIWQIENGVWKLSRGFSYDHQEGTPTQNDAAIDEKLLFKNKHETEKWLAKNGIPALGIGFLKNGNIEEMQVYGELSKGKPAPLNTIFNVASLTKPVTALVVLKLIDAGKWKLDEPLFSYWTDPDVAHDPRSKKLTTRHILSHQTGFSNWRFNNAVGKLAFEFEPGTKFQYSGEGFEYLRKALENKFKKPLGKLAEELIFKPLQMNDTKFYWDKTVDETRFAQWHDGKGNLYKTFKNTTANGADDLLTTVEDYTKFLQHVMNGGGLKKELYADMISNQVRVKANKYISLGWWVDENIGSDGEIAITHGGDDKGVHTIVFMLPKSKQGLVIFTNSDTGTSAYMPVILSYLGELGQGIIDVETK